MRITDYVRTAQTNLLRTKLRTFLTVFAFVIGTFTLAMTTAFGQGLQAYINTQLSAYGQPDVINVSVGNTPNQASSSGVPYYEQNRQATATEGRRVVYTLNAHDLAAVKSTAGVVAAYPDFSAVKIDYIQYGNGQQYVMQLQSAFPGQNTNLSSGHFPTAAETSGLVLPYPYVEALGFSDPNQLIGKSVRLQLTSVLSKQTKTYTAHVTGVLPDTVKVPLAYLSYQMLGDMMQYQANTTNQFNAVVAFISSNASPASRAQIKNSLQSKDYKAQTYDDLLQSFSRPLSIIRFGLDGFAAIALLAATIGIINTLLMAVLERTQEIGLLKALGMRRRSITLIYLLEAASIGFWGGVVGVMAAYILGMVANPLLNHSLFKGIGKAHILVYPLPAMVAIIGGAMIIGLIAGTLPAIRAGKLDPIEALRRE